MWFKAYNLIEKIFFCCKTVTLGAATAPMAPLGYASGILIIIFISRVFSQDFEVWDDVGLNIPKPFELLHLYRESMKNNHILNTTYESCGTQTEGDMEEVELLVCIQPFLNEGSDLKYCFFQDLRRLVPTQARSGDPGQGGGCQWGQFGMRASPYAPPNIEDFAKISIKFARNFLKIRFTVIYRKFL